MAKKKPARGLPEGYLDYEQACDKLGVARRTLQRYKALGKLPKEVIYRTPGRVGFKEAGLQKIIDEGGIK